MYNQTKLACRSGWKRFMGIDHSLRLIVTIPNIKAYWPLFHFFIAPDTVIMCVIFQKIGLVRLLTENNWHQKYEFIPGAPFTNTD